MDAKPKWSFSDHITHSICPHSQHSQRETNCVIETNGRQIAHCIMTRGKTISRISLARGVLKLALLSSTHDCGFYYSPEYIVSHVLAKPSAFLIVWHKTVCVCVYLCVCTREIMKAVLFSAIMPLVRKCR